MPGNLSNTNQFSGKGTAVIVGTICLIGPWFTPIGFGVKLLISLVGAMLIYLGTR